MNNTIKICLLFISATAVGMIRNQRYEGEFVIHAKEVKEKPVWVADVDATVELAEFLEKKYLTPGLCYKIDEQVAIDGTTVLWDEEVWGHFVELLQRGAHCKGALTLLAIKITGLNTINKESKRALFSDIIKHYVSANPDTWDIIKYVVACQSARYAYLISSDE